MSHTNARVVSSHLIVGQRHRMNQYFNPSLFSTRINFASTLTSPLANTPLSQRSVQGREQKSYVEWPLLTPLVHYSFLVRANALATYDGTGPRRQHTCAGYPSLSSQNEWKNLDTRVHGTVSSERVVSHDN